MKYDLSNFLRALWQIACVLLLNPARNYLGYFFDFLSFLIKNYFLAVLGLCCCAWDFSSCSLPVVLRLLTVMASFVSEHRLEGSP